MFRLLFGDVIDSFSSIVLLPVDNPGGIFASLEAPSMIELLSGLISQSELVCDRSIGQTKNTLKFRSRVVPK